MFELFKTHQFHLRYRIAVGRVDKNGERAGNCQNLIAGVYKHSQSLSYGVKFLHLPVTLKKWSSNNFFFQFVSRSFSFAFYSKMIFYIVCIRALV